MQDRTEAKKKVTDALAKRRAPSLKTAPTLEQEVLKGPINDVPIADDGVVSAPTEAASGNHYGEAIDRQGGWGLSEETRNALGANDGPTGGYLEEVARPVRNLIPNIADLGFRGLQAVGAGIEGTALYGDDLIDATGLNDAQKEYTGNDFHPGRGVLALGEAFPLGGVEAGMTPVPRLGAQEKKIVEGFIRAGDEESAVKAMEDFTGVPRTEESVNGVRAGIEAVKADPKTQLSFPEPEAPTTPIPDVVPPVAEVVEPSKYVGSINVDNLGLDDVGRDNLRVVNEALPIEKTRIPLEDTAARANEVTPESYLADESFKGLDGKIAGGKNLLRQSIDEMSAAARDHGAGSPELAESLQKVLGLAPKHSENAGELGRGLNALNRPKVNKFGDVDQADEAANDIAKMAANPETADKLVELVNTHADSPDAINKIRKDASKPGFRDYVFSARYNMMLSGLMTHAKNILGTATNGLLDYATHAAAAPIGKVRNALFDGPVGVTGKELSHRAIGGMVGARRGLTTMAEAYRTGRPLDGVGRNDMVRRDAMKWEIPVKAMAAEDEFFRNVSHQSEMYGQAVRTAVDEGLTGDLLRNRIEELIDDPTDDMIKAAGKYSKRMRFQDDPGFIGSALERMRAHQPSDSPLTKGMKDSMTVVMPFVRTPDSIFRTALRYSPVGFLEGVNYHGLKAGGVERDLALARIAMGSSLSAYVASKVLDGAITGDGPRDYKERQAKELSGWKPNSFRNSDGTYTSYEGLDPITIPVGTIATLVERRGEGSNGKKDVGDYATQSAVAAANMAEQLVDKTYIQSLAGFLDTVEGGQETTRTGQINNGIANVAASFAIPAIVRQANTAFFDDKRRDTRGDDTLGDRIVGRIKSGIPGLSDDLPEQLDALGRPITKASSEATPLAKEITRLSGNGKTPLDAVPRTVNTVDYPMGRLNAIEHHNYQLATGLYFQSLMKDEMAKPEWKDMDDDERRELMKDVGSDARRFAREEVFSAPEGVKEADKPDTAGTDGESFTFGIPTSGLRSSADNKRVGGVTNSGHLDGDAMDFVPANGVSWKKLYAEAKRFFGPNAKVIHELPGYRNGAYHKEHVHVTSPGLDAPQF